MAEVTQEALQQFMIENGCKVRSSDAIEFFRLNFAAKVSDVSHSKVLFKKYMEELTSASVNTETGEKYLVLKRQHMVLMNSPHPYSTRSLRTSPFNSPKSSPRIRRATTDRLDRQTPPQPLSLPNTLSPTSCHSFRRKTSIEDVSLSPDISCYDSEEEREEGEEDELYDMELGSVGGCSNNQLEPNQKEWIYRAAAGDVNSVSRLLLQDRALVKFKDFVSGYTGLHWACKLGRLDMIQVLLASDSDINARAYNGMTPLHIAAQCGHEQVVDKLLKENAEKYVRDYNGKYPVFYVPSRVSPRIRDILSPPIPRAQKPRSGNLGRRPSLSSLDDVKRSDSSDSVKHSKQHMSQGLNLIRSSFRSKKANRRESPSPLGSPDTGYADMGLTNSTGTIFVRPSRPPLNKSTSASLPPLPPLTRHFKNIRTSMRTKKQKSAYI